MKKLMINAAMIAFLAVPGSLWAQKDKDKVKETEEIVIRKKGDKDINLKVEIKGDDITVNGKPLSEFNDDDISINKRKMTIRRDGGDAMTFDFGDNFMKKWDSENETRPFLGVTTEKVTDGAKITDVVKGSAAEKAGLKKDDIITKIDEDKIEGSESLFDVVSSKKPKQEVKVFYKRNGKESNVKAVLGEKKTIRSFSYNGPKGSLRSFTMPRIQGVPSPEWNEDMAPGADFDVTPYLDMANAFGRQKKLGLKIQDTEEGGNVKVINVEDSSAAAIAGLKKDDIITEIDGKKIENTDDAREQLMPDPEKRSYKIKATRDGKEMDFEVNILRKLKTVDF